MTVSPDLAILRFLAGRTHATVPAIGAATGIAPNQLRPRLAALESHRLVGSRQDAKRPAAAACRLRHRRGAPEGGDQRCEGDHGVNRIRL